MQQLSQPISRQQLKTIADARFGDMVKAVVDIDQAIIVIDADLHADQEKYLLENGSNQQSLWGINLYPEIDDDDWIEFDSMLNLRPSQDNNSRGVDDPIVQSKIRQIVNQYITA